MFYTSSAKTALGLFSHPGLPTITPGGPPCTTISVSHHCHILSRN
jgi:hypothetical protein